MSISLAGDTQAQADCKPHYWDIVGIMDINPNTGNPYGNQTPGTCRNCGAVRMFSSVAIQHTKGDFTVG